MASLSCNGTIKANTIISKYNDDNNSDLVYNENTTRYTTIQKNRVSKILNNNNFIQQGCIQIKNKIFFKICYKIILFHFFILKIYHGFQKDIIE